MFERIVVPLDGTFGSEKAIPVAATIARASGGSIIFVSVVLPVVEFGTYTTERTIPLKPGAFKRRVSGAANYLAQIKEAHANELVGIATEIDVADGAASPMIYETARLEGADLVVLCSHEEGGLKRWAFGSTAQGALHHSPVPVLVLNEHGSSLPMLDATHPLRMLVPLDGSALAEAVFLAAVQLMVALTGPYQSEIHIFNVVDLPSVYGKLKSSLHMTDIAQEEARQQARQESETYVKSVVEACEAAFTSMDVKITSAIVDDTDVAAAILKEAEQTRSGADEPGYDMIVMATHGRGVLHRMILGSVTEKVLKTTKLPLLVVPPKRATRDEREERDDTTVVEMDMVQTWME